jgi:hypothetical protein
MIPLLVNDVSNECVQFVGGLVHVPVKGLVGVMLLVTEIA